MLKYDPNQRITMNQAHKRSWNFNRSTHHEMTDFMEQRYDEFKRDKALEETLKKQREEWERKMNQ